MYTVVYKPSFVRQYKKLPTALKDEVKNTIATIKHDPKNPILKSHKLKGKLPACWSCSVNYQYRIIFEYEKPDQIVLLVVGNHRIYQ